jgi:hypothetical protein
MAHDATERFALLDLDPAPRTDAARFAEATGKNLKDSKMFEWADQRATEGYTKTERAKALARAQGDVAKLPTLATGTREAWAAGVDPTEFRGGK